MARRIRYEAIEFTQRGIKSNAAESAGIKRLKLDIRSATFAGTARIFPGRSESNFLYRAPCVLVAKVDVNGRARAEREKLRDAGGGQRRHERARERERAEIYAAPGKRIARPKKESDEFSLCSTALSRVLFSPSFLCLAFLHTCDAFLVFALCATNKERRIRAKKFTL